MAHDTHCSGCARLERRLRPGRSRDKGQKHEQSCLQIRSCSHYQPKSGSLGKLVFEMFGATIAANTTARGAPQIFIDLGGVTILIRGRRPGEDPVAARPIRQFDNFSSHDACGINHFGFMYRGDLRAFCDEPAGQGCGLSGRVEEGGRRQLVVLCRRPRRRQHRVDAVLTEIPSSFVNALDRSVTAGIAD